MQDSKYHETIENCNARRRLAEDVARDRVATLWDAVRRSHARTRYYRLADDPEAEPLLKARAAALLEQESTDRNGVVVPFTGRRR
jgi:hypothetical protein